MSKFIFAAGLMIGTSALANDCPNLMGLFQCVETGSADAPSEIHFVTHYAEDFVVYYIGNEFESIGLRADGAEYELSETRPVTYKAACDSGDLLNFLITDKSNPKHPIERDTSVIRIGSTGVEIIEMISQGSKEPVFTRWSCSSLR